MSVGPNWPSNKQTNIDRRQKNEHQHQTGKYPEHFLPGAEELGSDEMRITALGTGRPFLRRSQTNACWLIELGNGDKFMFDFGRQDELPALEIPYNAITAYFATHLHTDHVGDFGQIWVGSWAGGRLKPLVGPLKDPRMQPPTSPSTERILPLGHESRCALPAVGAEVNCHSSTIPGPRDLRTKRREDYKFPRRAYYGWARKSELEWNDSPVYSGDTTPSEFVIENAQGVDVLIHETFNTVDQLMERSGYDELRPRPSTMIPWIKSRSGLCRRQVRSEALRRVPLLQRLRHGARNVRRHPGEL